MTTSAPSPHQALGLPETAGTEEVRRAFRRLAFELHPDRNGDPGAAEAFHAVREAYEALTGPPESGGVYLGGIVSHTEVVAQGGGQGRRRRKSASGSGEPVPSWQRTRVELHRALPERLGGAVRARLRREAPVDWAVETHWEGVRDLRWGICVRWDEIAGVREGEGAVDLFLTPSGARRLAGAVPISTLNGRVYRLPVRDTSRLAALVGVVAAG